VNLRPVWATKKKQVFPAQLLVYLVEQQKSKTSLEIKDSLLFKDYVFQKMRELWIFFPTPGCTALPFLFLLFR
jgi:hypothetical protein